MRPDLGNRWVAEGCAVGKDQGRHRLKSVVQLHYGLSRLGASFDVNLDVDDPFAVELAHQPVTVAAPRC
jgi:hypothetical protein